MTLPIYAIGDIHGQLDLLHEALVKITSDGGPDAQIIFLGDLTDRGPNSRGVIEFLMQGVAGGRNWTVLKGNHDRMMEFWLEDAIRPDPQLLIGYHWLHPRIGGLETLASYGVTFPERSRYNQIHPRARAAVPQAHTDFLASLPYYHVHDDLLFVHAGIRPTVALVDQSIDDLCWIRDEFLTFTQPHPWLVVHGHTAVKAAEHHGNRVNLDSGAAYGGPLTAAVFEGRDCWVLSDTGREALLPEV